MVAAYKITRQPFAALVGTFFEVDYLRSAVTPATAGTFTITVNGQTTAGIAFDALPSAVQSALEALSNVAPGDVSVVLFAGGPNLGTGSTIYQILWTGGAFDNTNPTVSITTTGLTGNPHLFFDSMRQTVAISGGRGLGSNPKGVVVEMTAAATLDTFAAHARMSVGSTDGSASAAVGYWGEDGGLAINADTGYTIDNAAIVVLPGTTAAASVARAEFVSFGVDSVTFDWTFGKIPASNFLGEIHFFQGTEMECKTLTLTGSSSINTGVTTTAVNFQLDGLFVYSCGQTFALDGSGAEGMLSLGFYGRSSNTQGVGVVCAEDNESNTSSGALGRADGVALRLTSAAKTVSNGARLEVTAVSSNGFTLTERVGGFALPVGCFAFRIGGRSVWAGVPSLAAGTTGTKSFTGAGFRVGTAMFAAIRVGALDTINSGPGSGAISFGIADPDLENGSSGALFRDNQAAADSKCGTSDTYCVDLFLTGSTRDWRAEVTVYASAGFDYLVETASSADRVTPLMAVAAAPLDASPTVTADTATVLFDADVIRQTSVAVTAATATAAAAAQLVHQAAVAVSAGAASTVFDADKISQASAVVSADTATTVFDTDVIRQASVIVAADTATTSIAAQLIHQTTVTVSADTATTSISGDVISGAITTDVAVTADTALTAIVAQLVRQAAVTVSADTATVLFDADVIRQTSVSVTADTATTSIAGQKVSQAAVNVSADTATTLAPSQLVHQTSVSVSADTATTVFDTDVIRQTSVSVSAGEASVLFDADVIRQTSVAVSASTATTVFDAQLVHQTTVTAQADTATVVISGEIVGTISADVTVTADTATALIAGQKRMHVTMDVTASAASVAFDTDVIRQTSIAISADTATVLFDADVIRQTSVAVSQNATSAAASGQLVRQTTLVLAAGPAVTVFDADKISQASVAVSASTATTSIPTQLVHQTDVAAQAATATVVIDGAVVQVSGSVAAQADTATVAISASVIRQASVAVQASTASAAVSGQHISQTDTAAQSSTATVAISAIFGAGTRTGDVEAQAPTAITGIVGQRIVQTTMAVQAQTAIARAFEVVVPMGLSAPGLVFIHEPAMMLFETWPTKRIAAAVAVRAGVASTNITGDVL